MALLVHIEIERKSYCVVSRSLRIHKHRIQIAVGLQEEDDTDMRSKRDRKGRMLNGNEDSQVWK